VAAISGIEAIILEKSKAEDMLAYLAGDDDGQDDQKQAAPVQPCSSATRSTHPQVNKYPSKDRVLLQTPAHRVYR
jgi:hypothetical protein